MIHKNHYSPGNYHISLNRVVKIYKINALIPRWKMLEYTRIYVRFSNMKYSNSVYHTALTAITPVLLLYIL